jgi:hypothetical protein
MEALFRRVSRAQSSDDLSLSANGSLLLALTTIKPVYNYLLSSVWALEKYLFRKML